jgi:hypothetical protein
MKYTDRCKLKFSGSQVDNETFTQNIYLYMEQVLYMIIEEIWSVEHYIFNNKSIVQNYDYYLLIKENVTIADNSTFQKLGLSYFSLFIVDFSEYY